MKLLIEFVLAIGLAVIAALLIWIVASISFALWVGRYSRLTDIERRDISDALTKMREEWK